MRADSTWRRSKLEEVAQIQTGIAKGKAVSANSVELPYLRVANVQDGYVDLREIKTIRIDPRQVGRFLLRPGDVLFTEGGDADKLGRGCVWRGQIEPCLHQNHVFAVRVDMNHLLPEYLSAYASSSFGKSYFLDCAKQTTNLASINTSQLKAFQITVPPIAEQRKITAILASLDCALGTTQSVIDQLVVVKKALMADLLTRGVPGRHTKFKQTDIGELPAEWKVYSIGEISDVTSGGTPSRDRPEFWDGTIPWVKTGEIDYKEIVDTEERISAAGLASCSAKVVPKGSLLMAMYGQGVTRGRVALLGIDAALNQACLAILPGAKVSARFLFYVLMAQYEQLRSLGHEGTQKNLNAALIKSVMIPVPSKDEQLQIVAFLESIHTRQRCEESVLGELVELKSALSSALLSGEVRVTPDEKPA